MKKILILCPLPLETKALCDYFVNLNFAIEKEKVGDLTISHIKKLNLVIALGGHGKVQFAIHSQYLLSHIKNIDLVICAGSAGGLTEEVNLFDIIVAKKTIEHDYKMRFFKSPNPEFVGDQEFLNKFSQLSPKNFKIHFDTIASGDEDIMDIARAQAIHLQTSALAVAWEGAGGARAAQFFKKPFVEMRGITDNVHNLKSIDFNLNVKQIMENIGSLILDLKSGEYGN